MRRVSVRIGPELLARAKRPVDDGAVRDALQLRAHEGATLARLDVLELDELEDGAVDLDVHAVLELVGADHGRKSSRVRPADGQPVRATCSDRVAKSIAVSRLGKSWPLTTLLSVARKV